MKRLLPILLLAALSGCEQDQNQNNQFTVNLYTDCHPIPLRTDQNPFLSLDQTPTNSLVGQSPIEIVIPRAKKMFVWKLNGVFKAEVADEYSFSMKGVQMAGLQIGAKENTASTAANFSTDEIYDLKTAPVKINLPSGHYPIQITYIAGMDRIPVYVSSGKNPEKDINKEIKNVSSDQTERPNIANTLNNVNNSSANVHPSSLSDADSDSITDDLSDLSPKQRTARAVGEYKSADSEESPNAQPGETIYPESHRLISELIDNLDDLIASWGGTESSQTVEPDSLPEVDSVESEEAIESAESVESVDLGAYMSFYLTPDGDIHSEMGELDDVNDSADINEFKNIDDSVSSEGYASTEKRAQRKVVYADTHHIPHDHQMLEETHTLVLQFVESQRVDKVLHEGSQRHSPVFESVRVEDPCEIVRQDIFVDSQLKTQISMNHSNVNPYSTFDFESEDETISRIIVSGMETNVAEVSADSDAEMNDSSDEVSAEKTIIGHSISNRIEMSANNAVMANGSIESPLTKINRLQRNGTVPYSNQTFLETTQSGRSLIQEISLLDTLSGKDTKVSSGSVFETLNDENDPSTHYSITKYPDTDKGEDADSLDSSNGENSDADGETSDDTTYHSVPMTMRSLGFRRTFDSLEAHRHKASKRGLEDEGDFTEKISEQSQQKTNIAIHYNSGFSYMIYFAPENEAEYASSLVAQSGLQLFDQGYFDAGFRPPQLSTVNSTRIIEIIGTFVAPHNGTYSILMSDGFIAALQIGPGNRKRQGIYSVDRTWQILDTRMASKAEFHFVARRVFPFRLVVLENQKQEEWKIKVIDPLGSPINLFGLDPVQKSLTSEETTSLSHNTGTPETTEVRLNSVSNSSDLNTTAHFAEAQINDFSRNFLNKSAELQVLFKNGETLVGNTGHDVRPLIDTNVNISACMKGLLCDSELGGAETETGRTKKNESVDLSSVSSGLDTPICFGKLNEFESGENCKCRENPKSIKEKEYKSGRTNIGMSVNAAVRIEGDEIHKKAGSNLKHEVTLSSQNQSISPETNQQGSCDIFKNIQTLGLVITPIMTEDSKLPVKDARKFNPSMDLSELGSKNDENNRQNEVSSEYFANRPSMMITFDGAAARPVFNVWPFLGPFCMFLFI